MSALNFKMTFSKAEDVFLECTFDVVVSCGWVKLTESTSLRAPPVSDRGSAARLCKKEIKDFRISEGVSSDLEIPFNL